MSDPHSEDDYRQPANELPEPLYEAVEIGVEEIRHEVEKDEAYEFVVELLDQSEGASHDSIYLLDESDENQLLKVGDGYVLGTTPDAGPTVQHGTSKNHYERVWYDLLISIASELGYSKRLNGNIPVIYPIPEEPPSSLLETEAKV